MKTSLAIFAWILLLFPGFGSKTQTTHLTASGADGSRFCVRYYKFGDDVLIDRTTDFPQVTSLYTEYDPQCVTFTATFAYFNISGIPANATIEAALLTSNNYEWVNPDLHIQVVDLPADTDNEALYRHVFESLHNDDSHDAGPLDANGDTMTFNRQGLNRLSKMVSVSQGWFAVAIVQTVPNQSSCTEWGMIWPPAPQNEIHLDVKFSTP